MSSRLRVNPIACDGHGLCAELFPERVSLDDWGYPIIDGRPVPRGLEEHASLVARGITWLHMLDGRFDQARIGAQKMTETLEAAGHTEPVEFTARVGEVRGVAVVLRAELGIDRTKFAMPWSPLRIAAPMAHGTVVARFVRE